MRVHSQRIFHLAGCVLQDTVERQFSLDSGRPSARLRHAGAIHGEDGFCERIVYIDSRTVIVSSTGNDLFAKPESRKEISNK